MLILAKFVQNSLDKNIFFRVSELPASPAGRKLGVTFVQNSLDKFIIILDFCLVK